MSLKKNIAVWTVILCGWQLASADMIQLKDKAAVTGKILAEKSDSIVVDVGYTVLVVPRSSIAGISTTDTTAPQTSAMTSPIASVNVTPRFYYDSLLATPARDGSSLVKQIGEAVVQ